ncbi:MAG: gliding motility-associated C-terminal domain-containing protein, partial [Bacteroidales bacterium]
HLILQNPTSHLSKPLKDAIQWHNDPPVQMEYVRSDILPPYQYFYYRTKIPTQQKVNFKVRICYNEGDSLYEKEYSRLSRTPACDPYLYASDYELCKGEEFSLFVMGNNPNDSIFSVQWDSIPHCAIDLINSKFKNQFEFTTKAYKDTTYRVRIRALNNDSIREYVDSISSVKVRAQPHSFTTDKVSICRGTQIDLKNYENRPPNEGGVNRILYPGNNSIFSRHNSASVIVQAESYYLCKWMHGNKVYWDSIFVQVDTTLWATAMPDTTVCQYAKVQLIGNSNGVLTWVKNGSVLYEKIPVDSVVYDIIEADAEYKLVFENACEKDTTHLHIYIRPAPLLQIIPYTEICIHDSISLNIDNHTCLPNSLYWTYTHDSLLGEQKIASAQVKNIPLNYSDTTYFYAHGIGYNACPMQSLCKVMVYPLPKVQLQVDGDSVLCAKGNTSLVLCASGAQSYYFPQFNCSSCTKYRTSVDTTTIFSVEGTDEHGCVNEGRFHFIVNENVLKLEDTGFCERQAFCLLADSVANASYRWIDPRGKVISERICMCLSQLSKQDEGIYQLLLHQFSCTDTNKVRLYHKPTPYARIDKQNAPLCEGLSLSLAASSNQIKSQNYWILNDSSMVSQKEYTKTSVQVRDSGSYCFVSNLNHCADTSCVFVRVDTRTKPDFISSNLYCCEGDSVQLMASPIHDSIRYTWKTKNRNLIMLNNIASIPDIQLSENGSLCLQVQKYTCIDTICKPLQVRMRPNPSIVGNSFYCEFENVVISAQDTLAGAFSQWKYQGKPFKNAVKFEYPYIQCSDSGLYIFTQIFNACESRPDSFYLQVRPLPLINLGSTDYVCEGNHLLLDVERVGGSYLWSTGSIEPHIWVRDSALYWVDVVENQCHFRDSLYIYLRPTPFVHLGNDSILCKGDVLTLHGPNEAETFLWQDQSISNEFQVHQEGLYWLQATLNACSHRDSIQFVYKYCGRFFLPNAFTPNGDNLNDGYKVVLSAQKEEIDFTMWIYDKNGKLMFTTTNFDQAWDGSYHGKLCAAGIYICKVKIVDKIDKNIYTKTISVNLIR